MNEPQSKPLETIFSSDDSLVVVFEGPGENICRPRQPNNPREWPPRERTAETKQPPDSLPSSGNGA